MDTGSNKLPRQLLRVEFGCIPCTSYELKKPEHGMGYAPTYVCVKGRDPKECEVNKKNAEKK